VLIAYGHFVTLCINCKRMILANSNPNLLCSHIITCFPILGDIIERLKIRESRTYFIFAIGRSMSCSKLMCYAIVLKTT